MGRFCFKGGIKMITIESIIQELRLHDVSPEKLEEIRKSYHLAAEIHKNQYRQSGEPYIIHPLHVANNLLKMEVYDPDTISAALLHDTIEDAEIDFTKEDVADLINPTVAELVDGVTKMRRMNFSTTNEQTIANTRKIINGLTKDVRIIMVKLADRLHNMQTLEFKRPKKQKENAIETMELFVPLSLTIGAYRVKNELEDLSLQYIEPDIYKHIKEKKDSLQEEREKYLSEIASKTQEMLNDKGIPNEIIYRTQTICTIYKKLQKGYKMENMYDLFYLKILVEEIEDCYQTLCYVHRNYPPINGRFKDYIYNPRTNFYQSLHTTVSDNNGNLSKVKIRSFDMDKVAAYGIPAYWNIKNGYTKEETQEMIRKKCQFAKRLIEIDESFADNREFFQQIKSELLTEHVYAYSHNGDIIELPAGSTALDFACQVFPDILDKMTGVLVNGKEAPLNYVLTNNDRVQVLTEGKINHENWEQFAHTSAAKQKLKLLNKQN